MPNGSQSETRVTIDVSTRNSTNSEYIPILGSNEDTRTEWQVRVDALKQLPINLSMGVMLLGLIKSVTIYFENQEMEDKDKKGWIEELKDYGTKGFTWGLATAGVEVGNDYTAFAIVERIFKNVYEIITGKPKIDLEEKILQIINERFLSFGIWVQNFVGEKNQELSKKIDERIDTEIEVARKEVKESIEEVKDEATKQIEKLYKYVEQFQQLQEQTKENQKKETTALRNKIKKLKKEHKDEVNELKAGMNELRKELSRLTTKLHEMKISKVTDSRTNVVVITKGTEVSVQAGSLLTLDDSRPDQMSTQSEATITRVPTTSTQYSSMDLLDLNDSNADSFK